jgi:hypothetical protein
MKLPDAEYCVVPRRKVEDYLLNLEHPIGGGKAKFFMHFGFQRDRWEELVAALLRHAQENGVSETFSDTDGDTFVIEGMLMTPSGREPRVRTVWLVEIFETGRLAPRFITAYPLDT